MSGWCSKFKVVLTTAFLLAASSGCGTLSSHEADTRKPDSIAKPADQAKTPGATPAVTTRPSTPGITSSDKVTPPPGDKGQVMAPEADQTAAKENESSSKVMNEEILDSALEYCEAANDFWQRGEPDSAIDALDKAYALILKLETDDDPDLLQQKEDLRLTISKRIVEVYASRYTVAAGISNAIPRVMNRHVIRELESFKTREREFFMTAYRRSGKYRSAIAKALRQAGFPEELSWLPLIESGFKVRALSRARALGMWQFIASTGYRFGLKRETWIDERMDFEKSTQAAIAYLRELHQIFGDWTTALAAYNCGEYAVLNRIKTQKINYLDQFWDLYEKLPHETAAYVPRFMAVLHIVSNPEAHGMTLPPLEKEMEWEEVIVSKQIELKTVAEHLGVPLEELEEMNAELRQSLTPDSPYSFKVPVGKRELLLAKMDSIPAWCPPARTYLVHKVRQGETLKWISARYKASPDDIIAVNGLWKNERLRPGMKLKIPANLARSVTKAEKASVKPVGKEEKPIKYVVKKGDSLYQIANRFSTTAKEIQSYNRLPSPNLLMGQALLIPSTSQENCPPGKTRNYKVKEGDSPFIIARKHQMNLADLLKLNNLTPQSTIFPGQELVVTGN